MSFYLIDIQQVLLGREEADQIFSVKNLTPFHVYGNRVQKAVRLRIVFIRKLRMRNYQFPNWKAGIFSSGKKIKGLRGGLPLYAAQARPKIDAARAKKHPFRTETRINLLQIRLNGTYSAAFSVNRTTIDPQNLQNLPSFSRIFTLTP